MKERIEKKFRLKPLQTERSAVGKDFAIEGELAVSVSYHRSRTAFAAPATG